MFKLKADNRQLLKNAKYSFALDNYLSGVSSIQVDNSVGFEANMYVLLGNFGSETAEIIKINTVTSATNTLSFTTTTKFAHAESTKVTVIPYNQVRFYHTATATFSASSPVTDYINIQADSFFTIGEDTTNTTGFGWFVFYNSTTTTVTQNSNAIPYAGFGENSVKAILDTFYSQLNNKELKLISDEDAFSWLNEAYSVVMTELNLVNQDFQVSDEITINTTSGTKEYALESDFSELVSIYNSDNETPVEKIDLRNVLNYDETSNGTLKYYLRGDYIGFSPTPSDTGVYKYRYIKKTGKLSSYYDNVNLPDNSFYLIKDYMLFRASPKLNRGNGGEYFQLFNESIKRMKNSSVKRDENPDTWGKDISSLV